jgi:cobaltochelatase CobT
MAPPAVTDRRADADRRAAWRRWHDVGDQQQFEPSQRPWYALLERARVEVLAGRGLRGMARNLQALDALAPADDTARAVYVAARNIFAGTSVETRVLPPSRHRRSRWWNALTARPQAAIEDAARLDDPGLMAGLRTAAAFLADSDAFVEAIRPLVAGLAARTPGMADASLAELPTDGDDSLDPGAVDPLGDAPAASPEQVLAERLFPDYQVQTRRWDQELPASELRQAGDEEALRQLLVPDRQRVRRLAHRLQRRLQAMQLRRWSFDQAQGLLDSRRLSRLLVPAADQAIFRVEDESVVPEACVSLLVDQSGSMDAQRRLMAALAIDLAVHSLELCRIRCEVLGFTTRFGDDNPIADGWRRQGSPAMPGRLNALRHIVYKGADQPWRQARGQLGLMLRADFGNENIDGESLHWAVRRLLRRREPRKLLIVLSDGAPYDRATAEANGRGYLEHHLRQVVSRIETSPVHVLAIGTGQDVSRFYRHACVVRHPEQVPDVMFEQLGELLTAPFAGAPSR